MFKKEIFKVTLHQTFKELKAYEVKIKINDFRSDYRKGWAPSNSSMFYDPKREYQVLHYFYITLTTWVFSISFIKFGVMGKNKQSLWKKKGDIQSKNFCEFMRVNNSWQMYCWEMYKHANIWSKQEVCD